MNEYKTKEKEKDKNDQEQIVDDKMDMEQKIAEAKRIEIEEARKLAEASKEEKK